MACPSCGCKEHYQYNGADFGPDDERLERCAACGAVFDIEDAAEEDERDDSAQASVTPFTGLGQRQQLEPAEPIRQPPERTGKTERMRTALRTLGPLPAKDLKVIGGVRDSGVVGALMKHDIHLGNVEFRAGLYAITSKGCD